MAAIEWNDSLSVRILSIDNQHKRLIDLINNFYKNIQEQTSKEKMSDLIRSLKEYTIIHFSTEEKYMKKFGFPDYEMHKAEHEKFVDRVHSFEERYKTGKLLLTVEVTNFIKDWVSNHIMQTDKKYSEFFIQHGVR